ncbi:MAG TPA: hypothetical protein VEO01_00640 [Pseudonocardiaceae bacterium]|nr:hypothetical protein [Pseudonocardiaceae bacterium]
MKALTLTVDEILEREMKPEPTDRVIFKIDELYGIAPSTSFPLNETESVETGQIVMMIDPRTDPTTNLGIVDFTSMSLRVRYGIQAVFPGLHEMVMSGKHDLSLLGPVRAIATDECKLTEDLTGWRAFGCLELLPGSLWSGAKGG